MQLVLILVLRVLVHGDQFEEVLLHLLVEFLEGVNILLQFTFVILQFLDPAFEFVLDFQIDFQLGDLHAPFIKGFLKLGYDEFGLLLLVAQLLLSVFELLHEDLHLLLQVLLLLLFLQNLHLESSSESLRVLELVLEVDYSQ